MDQDLTRVVSLCESERRVSIRYALGPCIVLLSPVRLLFAVASAFSNPHLHIKDCADALERLGLGRRD
jgi:hypothetical protein